MQRSGGTKGYVTCARNGEKASVTRAEHKESEIRNETGVTTRSPIMETTVTCLGNRISS